MWKKAFSKTAIWLTIICMITGMLLSVGMPTTTYAAYESDNVLNATNISILISDEGAVYRPGRDMYIIGPDGWIEWHITFNDKITGLGGDYPFEPQVEYGYEQKIAECTDKIGDHTLVFRFTGKGQFSPKKSGRLDFDKLIELPWPIRYSVVEREVEVTKSASKINLSNLSSMSQVYFRNEWPKFTISPDPTELLDEDGYLASGLTLDNIALDLYEDVMEPEDFEIRYSVTPGDVKTDWTTCSERNLIEINERARQGSVSVFVEIRDCVGNYRPYSLYFPMRGEIGTCRISLDDVNILGGESMYMYVRVEDESMLWSEDPFREFTRDEARRAFKQYKRDYIRPQVAKPPLALFVYSKTNMAFKLSTGKEVGRYTESVADIDMENTGFIWSTNPQEPDPDDPVFRFKREVLDTEGNPVEEKSYYKGVEYAHGKYREGYWCIINPNWYDLDKEGEYYLYFVVADKVTGGKEWRRVIYNRDQIPKSGMYDWADLEPVKFIVDRTPPRISFSSNVIYEGDKAEITIEDNVGVLAAQYQLCTDPDCSSQWHDGQEAHDIVTGPIGPYPEKAEIPDPEKVEFEVDTSGVVLQEGQTSFKIHVRAVESKYFDYTQSWSNKKPFEYYFYNPQNAVHETKTYYRPSNENEKLDLKLSYFGSSSSGSSSSFSDKHKLVLHAHERNGAIMPAYKGKLYYSFDGGENFVEYKGGELVFQGEPGKTYFFQAKIKDSKGLEPNIINRDLYTAQSGQGGFSSDLEVSFNTYELTDSVTVTFRHYRQFRINGQGEFDFVHTVNYTENGEYTINLEYLYGQPGQQFTVEETRALVIGNILKPGFAGMTQTPEIIYSTLDKTSLSVTAYLYVGKEVQPKEGVTYRDGWVSHTFDNNGDFVFDVVDLYGKELSDYVDNINDITASVSWINKTPPECTISYSTRELTKDPVTVTINCPQGVPVINNNRQKEYTFYKNGSFTFLVENEEGSIFEFTAVVENIDNKAPEITLEGPLSYSFYKGIPFDFQEPGFTAIDNIDGDVTGRVQVKNDIDVYKGGYQEIVYTVTDSVGNTARAVRGVMIYNIKNILLYVNGQLVSQEPTLDTGTLNFTIAGLESPEYSMKYLPGKCTVGDFKEAGTVIEGDSLTIDEPGWYTFYVRDDEMHMCIGHVELR